MQDVEDSKVTYDYYFIYQGDIDITVLPIIDGFTVCADETFEFWLTLSANANTGPANTIRVRLLTIDGLGETLVAFSEDSAQAPGAY